MFKFILDKITIIVNLAIVDIMAMTPQEDASYMSATQKCNGANPNLKHKDNITKSMPP
jgi:hypothetical protein